MQGKVMAWPLVAAGLFVLCAVAGAAASAVDLHLVKDLDARPDPAASSDPKYLVTIGGAVYFSASTPATGAELWRTDGTPEGLAFVADIAPGAASSAPRAIGFAGATLIVDAAVPGFGRELVAVTAAGAVRLTNTTRQWDDSPTFLPTASVSGRLLAWDSTSYALWSTDGTVQRTKNLTQDAAFPLRKAERQNCTLGGMAIIAGEGDGNTYKIVATDGTVAGTTVLATLSARQVSQQSDPILHDGRCHFTLTENSQGAQFWATDGTVAGTQELRNDLAPVYWTVLVGDRFFVQEYVAPFGFRIRRIEPAGTPMTVLHASTNMGYMFVSAAGKLWFTDRVQTPPNEGERLYMSDGTVAGTSVVFPAPGYTDNIDTSRLFDVGGAALFWPTGTYYEGEARPSYRIDPATGAIAPGATGVVAPMTATLLGNRLIGLGIDAHGTEIWRTDGSPEGTALLHDVYAKSPSGLSFGPSAQASARGEVLYFNERTDVAAGDATLRLWRTDGTASGTYRLADAAYDGGPVTALVAHRDGVVFASKGGFDQTGRYWRADGTLAAAVALTEADRWMSNAFAANGDNVYAGCEVGAPGGLCRVDALGAFSTVVASILTPPAFAPVGNVGTITIFAETTNHELWRTDGTAPGTFRLAQNVTFQPARPIGTPHAEAHGKLYFPACLAGICGIASTDGTAAGTDVLSVPATRIDGMATIGDRVVFGYFFNDYGPALWAIDGTPAGTVPLQQWIDTSLRLSDFAVVGGVGHVMASCSTPCANAKAYLVTDGTAAGTRFVPMPAGTMTAGTMLGALGNSAAAFTCSTAQAGEEVCVIDRDGTSIVPAGDINPGAAGSKPRLIGRTANALYFGADDGAHGVEPWMLRLADALFADGFD